MLNSANKIPITLICGYLGAGKTSLINQLLASATKPLGILVNDFGALNIDADLINNSAGQTLELTNGCLCCQITDDLGDSLQQLAETNISEVIIEASGVAQPASIREYVQSWPGYRLAGTFTVIDASQIERLLAHRYARPLVNKQINQADILLLAKTDLINALADTKKNICQQFQARFGKPSYDLQQAPISWILDQNLCPDTQTPETEHPQPTDQVLLEEKRQQQKEHKHNPEAPLSMPFASTSWAPSRPLAQQTLCDFLDQQPQIIRAKGWFNDTTGQCWLIQSVGDRRQFEKQPVQHPSRLVFIYPAADKPAAQHFSKLFAGPASH
ncbi:MAG: GTP-binding protein [Pseudomonadales bacterium]|nr:GTP-binding protein [Pseudomonadales bacterium]